MEHKHGKRPVCPRVSPTFYNTWNKFLLLEAAAATNDCGDCKLIPTYGILGLLYTSGGGGGVLAKIKAAYCAALPSGRTLGLSGGTGGTGTVPGAAELVTNFDTGKTTVVVSGGAGFGWNGGAQ